MERSKLPQLTLNQQEDSNKVNILAFLINILIWHTRGRFYSIITTLENSINRLIVTNTV